MTHYPVIIRNAIQTPDGTILESKYRHECIEHTDTTNGVYYMRDGGRDYIRGCGEPCIDLTVTTDDPHEKVREAFMWTSILDAHNTLRPEPVVRKLSELEDSHVISLVYWTETGYPEYIHTIFKNEMKFRNL